MVFREFQKRSIADAQQGEPQRVVERSGHAIHGLRTILPTSGGASPAVKSIWTLWSSIAAAIAPAFRPMWPRSLNNLKGFYAEPHPDNRSGWDQVGPAT